MAKNDKKNASLIEANEENILEQIKNANKYSEDIVKKAAEAQQKKEEDQQIRELNEIKEKATYINLGSVLKTRLVRAQEKAISGMRETSRDLLNQVIKGELTAADYEKKLDEALEEANKKVDAAIKEYDNGKLELRNKFQAHYRFDWDNPFNRVRSVECR